MLATLIDHADHLGLIRFVMKRAKVRERFQAADADDIEQELYFTLRRCAERYDGRFRFSTYAVKSMRAAVMNAYTRRRGNSKTHRKQRRIWRGERAGETDVWVVRTILFSEINKRVEHYAPFLATVPPTDEVVQAAECRRLASPWCERAFDELHPRSAEVLKMRHGFGRYAEHTLDEIARVLLLTRERVRQIQAKGELSIKNWAKEYPSPLYS